MKTQNIGGNGMIKMCPTYYYYEFTCKKVNGDMDFIYILEYNKKRAKNKLIVLQKKCKAVELYLHNKLVDKYNPELMKPPVKYMCG